jgi:hypothetical protein
MDFKDMKAKRIEPAGVIDLETMEKVDLPEPRGRSQMLQDWKGLKKDDRVRVTLEGTVIALQINNPKIAPSYFVIRTPGGLKTIHPDQEKPHLERLT